MKKILLTLSLCSFLFSFIHAQNTANMDVHSLQNGNDSISFLSAKQNITINDSEGYIEIGGVPPSENDQSTVYFSLVNKGINGGDHRWRMATASYAGGWGGKIKWL